MIQLRDYQERIASQAVRLLQTTGLCYLAMQVRTGKTLTSLHAANEYLKTLNVKDNLVLFITKKKAISSIMSDAAALDVKYDLLVINYEQIKNIEPHVRKGISLVIMDEAHSLGAYPKPSERTKQFKEFIFTRPVIYLSGTPSPESESQLYHQFFISSLSPFAEYPNFYKWAKDYVNIQERHYGHGKVYDYSKAKRDLIMKKCGHLFINFTQQEAGFTEMVEEEVLTVKMKESTYAFADALKNKRVLQNKLGDVVIADSNVKLMQKLHQIYSGTVIVDEPKRCGSAFDTSKIDFIKERFANQKIAIFYKFVEELALIRSAFGSKIVETPEEFRDNKDVIFVSQIQSGREGINLSTADALIMYNIDFSAVSYFQARARMQSKERTKPARLFWIFADSGIESKIYEKVKNKEDYTLNYFKKDFNIKQYDATTQSK